MVRDGAASTLWWRRCGGGAVVRAVVAALWWRRCGGGAVVAALWWRRCGVRCGGGALLLEHLAPVVHRSGVVDGRIHRNPRVVLAARPAKSREQGIANHSMVHAAAWRRRGAGGACTTTAYLSLVSGNIIVSALKTSSSRQHTSQCPKSLSHCRQRNRVARVERVARPGQG